MSLVINAPKYIQEVLEIIENHAIRGTHFAVSRDKAILAKWMVHYGDCVINLQERDWIKMSINMSWYTLKDHPQAAAVTAAFLCDLVTHALYERGYDVWTIITEGERA